MVDLLSLQDSGGLVTELTCLEYTCTCGSNFLIGAASSIGTAFGILSGFASTFLIRQFKHYLLFATFAASACVMFMYSLMDRLNWLVLIAAILQGAALVIEWNVFVFIMRQIVADNQTGAVYSIMTLTSRIGKLISSVLAGYLYSTFGPVWLFRIFAFIAVLSIIISCMSTASISYVSIDEDKEETNKIKNDAHTEVTHLISQPTQTMK
ncbi:uncharacterized protein [Antedon mediterranea]|uniref:uncharacterized protein n=1 Tax=Antedon mediterranea TaxID=105859 RepID=UPI003AF5968C